MNKYLPAGLALLTMLACTKPEPAKTPEIKKKTAPHVSYLYPDATMNRLQRIADSLNLKYRVCNANPVYYALPQGKAHWVFVGATNAKQALQDMKAGMPFETFVSKYEGGGITIKRNVLVWRTIESYRNVSEIRFRSLEYYNQIGVPLTAAGMTPRVAHTWRYMKMQDGSGSIKAFYFTEDLKAPRLAPAYARLVQYTDCVVDTTNGVLPEKKFGGWLNREEKTPPALDHFDNWVDAALHKADIAERFEDDLPQSKPLPAWILFDSIQQHNPDFFPMLRKAVDVAKVKGGYTQKLEAFAYRYLSVQDALELKMLRRVTGFCSMDRGPVEHATAIAQLAAEATNWPVFIHAHLDILNDRFERASDASYGMAKRSTYMAELEALDIRANDLLMGMVLQYQNPVPSHYFGDIYRVGRALAESADSATVGNYLLHMCSDPKLDYYNRVTLYSLLATYTNCVRSPVLHASGIACLEKALASFPGFIAEQLKQLEASD